jgi:hypothetical protein
MKRFLVIALVMFISSYQLVKGFSIDSDFARDLFNIGKIAAGKMVWLGPRLSAGFNISPSFYYPFVPGIGLTHKAESVLITQFSLALLAIALILKYSLKAIPTLFISTLPVWITVTRHPGNGFTYVIWLLMALSLANTKYWTITWLFYGLAIANHPAAILALPFVLINFKNITLTPQKIALALGAVIIPWLPIIVFELITRGFLLREFINHSNTTFRYFPHYLFGIEISIAFVAAKYMSKFKIGTICLCLLTCINLINLKTIYKTNPERSISKISNQVKILESKINYSEPIAVLAVMGPEAKAPLAEDYRFFLEQDGIKTTDLDKFPQANQLVVFSETPNFDVINWHSWETTQFFNKPTRIIFDNTHDSIRTVVFSKN